MQDKHILLVILFFAIGAIANSSPVATLPGLEQPLSCNIPAPTNFHAEDVGSTWVELEWDFQTDALGGYRIRAYRTSDNALISTTFCAQNVTNVTIHSLAPGVEYKFVINARCVDGSDSDHTSYDIQVTIVGELIVCGFNGNYNNPPSCNIYTANTNYPNNPGMQGTFCTFDYSTSIITPFSIESGSNIQQFGLRISEDDNTRFQFCQMEANNGNNPIWFRCESYTTAYCTTLKEIIATKLVNGFEVQIARFAVIINVSGCKLVCTSLASGCEIKKYAPASERSNSPNPRLGTPTISPNPFSDQLEVNLGAPLSSEAQLQLLGLNGQLLINNTLSAGQQQVSLQTNHLSAGIYLLRVVNDGQVQTWKVIKQE